MFDMMTNSKEKDLLANLHAFAQDVITNETAILSKTENRQNEYDIVAYTKTELGGDSIQIIENIPEELIPLNKVLKTSTIESRKAIWNFLTKALS